MHIKIVKNKIKSGLYIVSTPIGNLGDMSFRAIEILKKSDFILCEDTRISKKLLLFFNINTKLISNHKFNEKKNIKRIIDILNLKKIVSIISDAGTPTISDPGKILIDECIKRNVDVIPVPGPSSFIAALSISGFSDKCYFHGFLPEKISLIEKDFNFLSKLNSSIVFFLSAKKINKIIDLLKKYFSNRNVVICREMTKLFEEYIRSPVKDLNQFTNNLRGEITFVISEIKESKKDLNKLDESDKEKIKKLVNKLSIKDIVDIFNEEKNVSKKEIYNYCLTIKNEN